MNVENKNLTSINPELMVPLDEAYDWHIFKDKLGPTDAGSPSWKSFVELVERKLKVYGLVDIIRHTWTYNRYYVNDWPVHEGVFGLLSDGEPVPVASFVMCSGSTDYEGITRPMVYYDSTLGEPTKGMFKDKIVVLKTVPHPQPPYTKGYLDSYTITDHEYRSPGRNQEMYSYVDPSENNSFNTRWVFGQFDTFRNYAIKGQAAGMVILADAPWETLKGLHQRTAEYDCPSLVLNRGHGIKVLSDAKAGRNATLKLIGEYIPSETYNFIGFLPGRDYQTDKDSYITIRVHTDGMSLTQDNGALGAMAIAKYFSQIPQPERPRTIMFYIDCRHFMPGGEDAPELEAHNLLSIYPELMERTVAVLGIEHLGEMEGIEIHNKLLSSDFPEYSYFGVNDNDYLIDLTIDAIKDNRLPRADVKCSVRPGIHGGMQMLVKSAANCGRRFRVPVISLAANWCGYHTQVFAGIERFGKGLFVRQIAVINQIIGSLMLADPIVLNYTWVELIGLIRKLPAEALATPDAKTELIRVYTAIFSKVRLGAYSEAANELEDLLKEKVTELVDEDNREALLAKIDEAAAQCLV